MGAAAAAAAVAAEEAAARAMAAAVVAVGDGGPGAWVGARRDVAGGFVGGALVAVELLLSFRGPEDILPDRFEDRECVAKTTSKCPRRKPSGL